MTLSAAPAAAAAAAASLLILLGESEAFSTRYGGGGNGWAVVTTTEQPCAAAAAEARPRTTPAAQGHAAVIAIASASASACRVPRPRFTSVTTALSGSNDQLFADIFGPRDGGDDDEAAAAAAKKDLMERRAPIPSRPSRNRIPPQMRANPAAGKVKRGRVVREGWTDLKEALYATADKIGGGSKDEDDDEAPRPVEGYAETVEKVKRRPGETPAQAIMRSIDEREAQPDWERSKLDYDAYQPSRDEVDMYEYEASQLFSMDVGAAEESDAEVETAGGFAAIKDGLYDAYDLLSGKKDETKKEKEGRASSYSSSRPVDRISDRTAFDPGAFSPQSRPNQNADPALRFVDPSVASDLSSPNPIARAKAEYAVRAAADRRKRRERDRQRRESAEQIKRAAYDLGDGFVSAAEVAARAAADAPRVTKETVDAVVDLPDRVAKTVTETVDTVKGAAEETKRITTTVVTDIRNLPDTVKTKVNETRKSIEDTGKAIKDTVEAVEDTAYDVGAAVRLVPPRPKPPPPPPPPPPPLTGTDLAAGIAKGVLEGTAKTAWWIGKGTLWLGGMGAQAVYDRAVGGLRDKGKEPAAAAARELTERAESKAEVEAALTELAEVDEELSREVADALKLAEEMMAKEEEEKKAKEAAAASGALAGTVEATAEEKTPKANPLFFTDIKGGDISSSTAWQRKEIDDAVRKAREAAQRAANDAAELEAMLKGDDSDKF